MQDEYDAESGVIGQYFRLLQKQKDKIKHWQEKPRYGYSEYAQKLKMERAEAKRERRKEKLEKRGRL